MSHDKENVNILRADAIDKLMCSIQVGFNIREKGDTSPPGHQFIKLHMIFDEEMEDL